MNLGIDFGSTYSSFSYYNKEKKQLDLWRPHGYSEAIPSVACVDFSGQLITGHDAKQLVIMDNFDCAFRAFKMLLTERRPEILAERGYTEYTPEQVAEAFLHQQVLRIAETKQENIENLVICVPEVWNTESRMRAGMVDGRPILRAICERIPNVKNIQVVTEPAAASACFAYNYQQQAGKKLRGKILIVDYGGGTLDLTLTDVTPLKDSVEIKVLFRTGEGENSSGKIGNAGIAYMERIADLALAESSLLGEAPIAPRDSDFDKFVTTLEEHIKAQRPPVGGQNTTGSSYTELLYNAVTECGEKISRLGKNDSTFVIIKYGKNRVKVKYCHLWQAYEEVIQPDLEKCVKEVQEWMDSHSISYRESTNEQLHIVLVGGFGKFILVQRQLQKLFRFSAAGDARFRYGLGEKQEYAVAMGGALLAEGLVTLKRTAPYAIGIATNIEKTDQHCKGILNYAIAFREELAPNKEYWIPKRFLNPQGGFYEFLIGQDDNPRQGLLIPITSALVAKTSAAYAELQAAYQKKFPNKAPGIIVHNLGFSMDESEALTLLLREPESGKVCRIPLSRYSEVFVMSEAKKVVQR
ncbi:MAG: hypothetical protein E7464_00565 [Ruminococcaceae bacterium]|nr:hypothetical protein [Oscillospiraceae bacterium]